MIDPAERGLVIRHTQDCAEHACDEAPIVFHDHAPWPGPANRLTIVCCAAAAKRIQEHRAERGETR